MTNSILLHRDWLSNLFGDVLAGIVAALTLLLEAIGLSLIAALDGLMPVFTAIVGAGPTPKRSLAPQKLLAQGNSSDRALRRAPRMTIAERLGVWVAHRLLSGPMGERFSYNLARLGLHGLGIAPPVDLEGSGEKRIYTAILRKIRDARCLDVGANAGEFSRMLVRLGAARVVAVEPIPSTFERLKQSTRNLDKVDLVCCAVGERDGQISIHVPAVDEYSTLASRDISVTEVADQRYRTEVVPLRTIDSLVAENSWHFDIVKIDVEGFELEVLQGARHLIADCPPSILQFEFNSHHGRRGQHLSKLTDLLPGYLLYRIAPRSLRPIDPRHYLANIYAYQNILAVRQDRSDLINTQ